MADTNEPISGVALLCLDMQPGFLASIPDAARVLKRCQLAVAVAAGLGVPVIFTEQVPHKLGATVPELLAAAGKPRVFAKQAFSALSEPACRAALLDHGIEHVLLCGIETPICVYQTTLAAVDAGLQVTLLSDALSARRADDAAAVLATLTKQDGVHLLPTETVFYAWLREAAHPFFKRYTQLVKESA